MSNNLSRLILQNISSKSKKLDISDCNIKEIPSAVFELNWLEELVLGPGREYSIEDNCWKSIQTFGGVFGGCSIENIGNGIEKLINLKKIFINSDYLRNIAPLANLKNLEVISISCNASNLMAIKELSKLKQLYFYSPSFDGYLDSLKDLNKLEYLMIPTQNGNFDPLKNLANLQYLHLGAHKYGYNAARNLEALKSLNNLVYLYVESNKLENLQGIEQCIKLKSLIIHAPMLTNIQAISSLKGLEYVKIQSNASINLEPFEHLNQINHLSLKGRASLGIGQLKKLTNLKKLDISSNKNLIDISSLQRFDKLEEIDLHDTSVNNLTPLQNLNNLKKLNLSSTSVSDLSPLENLNKLETLNLFNSKEIYSLKPLANLINIKKIDLRMLEHIKDLSPLLNLSKKIPFISSSSSKEEGIMVSLHIPEFINNNEDLIRYWLELDNKSIIDNDHTKLIFVGNCRTGKTSLARFLRENVFERKSNSTHGIKIEPWEISSNRKSGQNLTIHIWDFGGQEYFHATHRLFFTENSVYVLVWDNETNKHGVTLEKFKSDDDFDNEIQEVELEHFPVSYWLDNIRHFGRNSPILIVQNKIDKESQKTNSYRNEKDFENCFGISIENAFEYQNGDITLKKFYSSFQDFKIKLMDTLRHNATQFKLVKYYVQVREALEQLGQIHDWVPLSDLNEVALRYDKTPDIQNLIAYLNRFTNTVLYFPNNELLKERLYLNPVKISRNIYRILDSYVKENNGLFDLTYLQNRLNCDEAEANSYIALMKEFDLLFEINNTTKKQKKCLFIAPQYLPKKEDISIDVKFLIESINFEGRTYLKFNNFVPRSLMLRFVAKKGALANQGTYWRNGIIYKSEHTQGMVRVEQDIKSSIFSIFVQDRESQLDDIKYIVNQFIDLNNGANDILISNDGNTYTELKAILDSQNEIPEIREYYKMKLDLVHEFNWLDSRLNIDTFKENIINLIGEANTKEALKMLLTWMQNRRVYALKNDIVLLLSQLSKLQKDKAIGLLTDSEEIVKLTQIHLAILNILDSEELNN